MTERYDVLTVRESNGPHERIPPLVLFKIPNTSRYVQVEKINLGGAGLADVDRAIS